MLAWNTRLSCTPCLHTPFRSSDYASGTDQWRGHVRGGELLQPEGAMGNEHAINVNLCGVDHVGTKVILEWSQVSGTLPSVKNGCPNTGKGLLILVQISQAVIVGNNSDCLDVVANHVVVWERRLQLPEPLEGRSTGQTRMTIHDDQTIRRARLSDEDGAYAPIC